MVAIQHFTCLQHLQILPQVHILCSCVTFMCQYSNVFAMCSRATSALLACFSCSSVIAVIRQVQTSYCNGSLRWMSPFNKSKLLPSGCSSYIVPSSPVPCKYPFALMPQTTTDACTHRSDQLSAAISAHFRSEAAKGWPVDVWQVSIKAGDMGSGRIDYLFELHTSLPWSPHTVRRCPSCNQNRRYVASSAEKPSVSKIWKQDWYRGD
jgi:hypothetical protein